MSFDSLLQTSYLARYFLWNAVDVTDYRLFPNREIKNSVPAVQFPQAEADTKLKFDLPESIRHTPGETLDQFLARNGTVAFLVLRNGQLLVQRYYNGYERSSICTSFSTAKSFISALIGIALHEGLIRSLDEAITKFIPEASDPFWSEITLHHLVSMSSGLKYNQVGFFPWDDEPRVYYSTDLRRLAFSARKAETPGIRFRYNNYNLLLLGLILERVTGGAVSTYLQEKLWQPLGMEFPASWSLDSQQRGMEKMESGLNACAVDFARFGQLYLQRGEWSGQQIIPESWVVESTTVTPEAPWKHYKYLWWVMRSGKGRFSAIGNLGQFIYVAPDKNCVIVRFGRGRPRNWKMVYPQLFAELLNQL